MEFTLDLILKHYGNLLKSVDEWFTRSRAFSGDAVSCGKGCSSCCRGLFDITLLDAFFLRRGFDGLSETTKRTVLSRVERQLVELRSVWPEITHPYILNVLPENDWDRLMPADDITPCALLGDNGLCLVYENRPMTCRLHGIPLVDSSGELFSDEWCTRNFTNDNPLEREGIRWEFRECFRAELLMFQEFTNVLLNQKINELDTFVPLAVLIDFHDFDWKEWWAENSEQIRNAGFPETPSHPPGWK